MARKSPASKQAQLPHGNRADVVKPALGALQPVKVIVVWRRVDIKLYVDTMVGGAFEFIVPLMTSDELDQVPACAAGSVSNLQRSQEIAAP